MDRVISRGQVRSARANVIASLTEHLDGDSSVGGAVLLLAEATWPTQPLVLYEALRVLPAEQPDPDVDSGDAHGDILFKGVGDRAEGVGACHRQLVPAREVDSGGSAHVWGWGGEATLVGKGVTEYLLMNLPGLIADRAQSEKAAFYLRGLHTEVDFTSCLKKQVIRVRQCWWCLKFVARYLVESKDWLLLSGA